MTISQIALSAMTVAALVFTVLAYPQKYGAQSGRSRLFRTVGVLLFDLLIMLVTLALFIDFKADVSQRLAIVRAGFYLASCYFLCFALMCVAILDGLESVSRLRRESRVELEKTLRIDIEAARVEARRRKAAGEIDEIDSVDGRTTDDSTPDA